MGVVAFTLVELLVSMFVGAIFGFFIGRDTDFVIKKKKKVKGVKRKA
jgi:prepilin-type N-terminal cleavage/methylation domain-containing protein